MGQVTLALSLPATAGALVLNFLYLNSRRQCQAGSLPWVLLVWVMCRAQSGPLPLKVGTGPWHFFFILVQAGPVPKCQESSVSSKHTVRAQILVDMCWGIRWTMPMKWDQQGKLGTMPEAIQGIIWKMPKECKLFTGHLNPSVLYSSPSSYERV